MELIVLLRDVVVLLRVVMLAALRISPKRLYQTSRPAS